MKHQIKNDKGQIISGKKKLAKLEYGTGSFSSNGEPEVNWAWLSAFADRHGFDTRNVEENGQYKMKIELPYGTELIRYGNESGQFTAPKGTKYENLALPYIKDTVEYNEYRVIATKIRVTCLIEKGKVAPGFGSSGGAVQFMHPFDMLTSVRKRLLERVDFDG